METYKGARTLAELKDFVNTEKGEAGKDAAEDGKVPEPKAASPVIKLDKDNFEAETKSGVAFVKFFAPWCGHCKRLAPTWEELAKKFGGKAATKNDDNDDEIKTVVAVNENVVIGHVDCTAADNINRPLCDAQGVYGFPTLHVYKDGVKVSFLLGC